jgi:hypothetical protein
MTVRFALLEGPYRPQRLRPWHRLFRWLAWLVAGE